MGLWTCEARRFKLDHVFQLLPRRMSSLAELFETSSPYLQAVEVAEDGRVAITFSVAGRTFTLPKEYVEAHIDNLLEQVPPWAEAGWLEAEYRRHGKLKRIAEAHGFSNAELRAMTHYAAKQLDWRIQEGFDIKRWELYTRFFEPPDPAERVPATALGRTLGIPAANVSLWVNEALAGKFFSKAMNLERLALIQSEVFDPVYFPGEEEKRDYALVRAKGWPQLPRGLLSDLLPRLENLELVSARRGKMLTLSLEHFGQPLVFSLEVEASPPQLSSLHRVEAAPGGKLVFSFAEGVVTGVIVQVRDASAGNFYLFPS